MEFKFNLEYRVAKNGIEYRVIRSEQDVAAAVAFYHRVFMEDEPMTHACGGINSNDFYSNGIAKSVEDVLKDGVSIMAIDTANDRAKMIGFRTSYILDRETSIESKRPSLEDYKKIYPEKWAHVMDTLNEASYAPDLFKHYPGLNRLFSLFAISTLPTYRGRGIAKEMMEHSLELAKRCECDGVFGLVSNPITVRLFEKQGLKKINTITAPDYFEAMKDREISGYFKFLKD